MCTRRLVQIVSLAVIWYLAGVNMSCSLPASSSCLTEWWGRFSINCGEYGSKCAYVCIKPSISKSLCTCTHVHHWHDRCHRCVTVLRHLWCCTEHCWNVIDWGKYSEKYIEYSVKVLDVGYPPPPLLLYCHTETVYSNIAKVDACIKCICLTVRYKSSHCTIKCSGIKGPDGWLI